MFFFLSKVLSFLLLPYTWLFIGLLLVWRKLKDKSTRIWLGTIILLFFIFSNSFLADEVMRLWEGESEDLYQQTTHYDVAILLGGMGRIDERQDRFDLSYAGDRLFQALELYHKGRVSKLMISGGSGSLRTPELKEAVYLRRYLLNIGVPDSAIIIEPWSKNTYENAVNSRKVLDSLGFKGSTLLVTSAFHMRRAMACFRKAGFTTITPYPTNRISGPRKWDWDHCLIPTPEAMGIYNLWLHEMVGYAAYKMKGYL